MKKNFPGGLIQKSIHRAKHGGFICGIFGQKNPCFYFWRSPIK